LAHSCDDLLGGHDVVVDKFLHLSLIAKIRTGLKMFLTTKAKSFASIESKTAREWLEGGSGREVYNTLWKRILELKFYELANDVS
ncbi:hypothetical protein ACC860_36840, partial [Rhizobium ruizarguesonis]